MPDKMLPDRVAKKALAAALKIGQEHGVNAASWFETDDPAAIVAMLDDCDPAVYDQIPLADLSGEMADGYTPSQLVSSVTFAVGDDADTDAWEHAIDDDGLGWELCDAYSEAFDTAVVNVIEAACRAQVTA